VSEHAEQAALCNWLDLQYPQALYFAIPNGAHLAGNTGQRIGQINKLKAEGFLPGVSDLFIAELRGDWAGCFVEMKAENGRLSDNQAEFLARAEERGYFTIVAYGFEMAQEMVREYLDGFMVRK
jgi:hypothetical protein